MIRVTAQSGKSAADVATHYTFAGVAVAMQCEIAKLAAYKTGEASQRFTELLNLSHEPPLLSAANADMHYHGEAPIAGELRRVRFWRRKNIAQLDINGEPSCQIDFDESHIHLINSHPLDSQINIELVTGPALVLLLSQLNIYCMHAACVSTAVGNIALVAESGVGKSTLSEHQGNHWQQISDDILPIALAAKSELEKEGSSDTESQKKKLMLLPDFPQLKLESAKTSAGLPMNRELDFVVRLQAQTTNEISLTRMTAASSMLETIRHTVAAKLFDTKTMRAHASFAKQLTGIVPVYALSYPRDLNLLNDVRDQIVEQLAGQKLSK